MERKTLIAERVFHVNRIKGLRFTQAIREYEPSIEIEGNVWTSFGLAMC